MSIELVPANKLIELNHNSANSPSCSHCVAAGGILRGAYFTGRIIAGVFG
jgi:hypothetical protein